MLAKLRKYIFREADRSIELQITDLKIEKLQQETNRMQGTIQDIQEQLGRHCKACDCLVNGTYAVQVEIVDLGLAGNATRNITRYYCKQHAPKYDRVRRVRVHDYGFGDRCKVVEYYQGQVRVTEQGKVVD